MGNKNNDKHLKFFLYSPSGDVTEDYYDPTRHYSEFKFESGKTFSNVFYPENDDIMQRLDFFTNNKAWYKQRGIPYTMGFLFYGDPGCGKTSTIKAIANHTQRHIVSVPLNKIKTAKELLNVFYNTNINYKDIPLDKRLFVLEDIDAADLKDTVGERSDKDTENKDDSEKEEGKDSGRESPMDLFGLEELPHGPQLGQEVRSAEADVGQPAGGAGRGDGDGGAHAGHHHQLPRAAGQGAHQTRQDRHEGALQPHAGRGHPGHVPTLLRAGSPGQCPRGGPPRPQVEPGGGDPGVPQQHARSRSFPQPTHHLRLVRKYSLEAQRGITIVVKYSLKSCVLMFYVISMILSENYGLNTKPMHCLS